MGVSMSDSDGDFAGIKRADKTNMKKSARPGNRRKNKAKRERDTKALGKRRKLEQISDEKIEEMRSNLLTTETRVKAKIQYKNIVENFDIKKHAIVDEKTRSLYVKYVSQTNTLPHGGIWKDTLIMFTQESTSSVFETSVPLGVLEETI